MMTTTWTTMMLMLVMMAARMKLTVILGGSWVVIRGYKSPNMGYKYSYPTCNYPWTSKKSIKTAPKAQHSQTPKAVNPRPIGSTPRFRLGRLLARLASLIYVYIYMYIHIISVVCMHACTYAYTSMYMHIYIYTCMYIYISLSLSIYIYNKHIYI